MNIPRHIAILLEDYVDGQLDAAGREQIASWFHASEENQSAFADWFLWQAELRELEQLRDLRQVFESASGASRETGPAAKAARPRRRPMPWLAVAATVAMAFFVWNVWQTNRDGERPGRRSRRGPRSVATASVAATLSRVANCVWTDDSQAHRVGDSLNVGEELAIESGLAQIYFESGARVVLSGPCRLRIDGPLTCKLIVGSVAADVPHEATGFTIRGANAEVIDLGTAFGFSVDAAGVSQVHVFEGEVVSRQLDARGEVVGESIRLVENQAVKFFPGQHEKALQLAADEARFIRKVPTLWQNDSISPLPRGDDLALWLRADHGVQVDAEDRVIAWQDLTLLGNKLSNDAFQPQVPLRPRLVRDAIGGRAALHFDGRRNFLSTPPMTTTDNQTIVVVFRNAPFSERRQHGGQLVNYNGTPSRYFGVVESPLSPGALQVGENVGSAVPEGSISAKAFFGDRKTGSYNVGHLRSKPFPAMQPLVVQYVYDREHNVSRLCINGNVVDEGKANGAVALTSRKIIGRHGVFEDWGFCGDISEVIIYNAALPLDDLRALSETLMSYYSIE